MKSLDSRQIRRVMVRATNWIGDAVMTTPALDALREHFPETEITVVANPLVTELFRFHPCCDRVIRYDRKGEQAGPGGFLRFCSRLRREGFDLAVLFQNAFEAALMARLAGIPRRAGYRTDGRGWLLNLGVPVGDRKHGLHHTDYYLHLLEKLGIGGGTGRLVLEVTADERRRAADLLPGRNWLAVNPGAAYGSAKRWFPERFAAVADRLAEEYGLRVVLTGGAGETEIGADIEKAMAHAPLNLIGRTSVREMMGVLQRCRLVVTNDSGPMHVAAALGVPVVAVFGPTDHATTSPLTDACRIVRHPVDCAPCLLRQCPTDHRCMERITVEDVLKGARELLGTAP